MVKTRESIAQRMAVINGATASSLYRLLPVVPVGSVVDFFMAMPSLMMMTVRMLRIQVMPK